MVIGSFVVVLVATMAALGWVAEAAAVLTAASVVVVVSRLERAGRADKGTE
jgi:hypothetical protein